MAIGSLVPKRAFVGIEEIAHLCAAGETPPLKASMDAVFRFMLDKARGAPGRAQFYGPYQQAKERLAAILNVAPDDLAFMPSVAEGMSLIANAVRWQPGDNVVVPEIEFPSVAYPWLRQRELHGVEVRAVLPRDGWYIDPADIRAAIDARTRVVAVSHVSYLTGQRLDLPALAEAAHAVGALFVVDASHALGAVPIEARVCDFLFSCCYKWILGTHGVAVAYWNRSRQPDFRSHNVGWHAAQPAEGRARRMRYTLKPNAAQLEAGNPSFISVAVLNEGAGCILAAGVDRIETHILTLGEKLRQGMLDLGLKVVTPAAPAERAGNYCFEADDPQRIHDELRARGVLVWGSDGRVRVSVHLYNDEADVDRALAALADLVRQGIISPVVSRV